MTRSPSSIPLRWIGTRSKRIILSPDSADAGFEPIVLDDASNRDCQILAELVAVIW